MLKLALFFLFALPLVYGEWRAVTFNMTEIANDHIRNEDGSLISTNGLQNYARANFANIMKQDGVSVGKLVGVGSYADGYWQVSSTVFPDVEVEDNSIVFEGSMGSGSRRILSLPVVGGTGLFTGATGFANIIPGGSKGQAGVNDWNFNLFVPVLPHVS
mmetsp:Transcript_22209/g.30548  ORF Transcript_22209/g.30548 Transcript_22209/m.30548 type:complete len:159 (-) Transcript_22209:134-610(-)